MFFSLIGKGKRKKGGGTSELIESKSKDFNFFCEYFAKVPIKLCKNPEPTALLFVLCFLLSLF